MIYTNLKYIPKSTGLPGFVNNQPVAKIRRLKPGRPYPHLRSRRRAMLFILLTYMVIVAACDKDVPEPDTGPTQHATPLEALAQFLNISDLNAPGSSVRIDGFIKLPDVPGLPHGGEIEIESFSWVVSLHVDNLSGKTSTIKAEPAEFIFTRVTDASSEQFRHFASINKEFPFVDFKLIKYDGSTPEELTLRFSEVVFTSFSPREGQDPDLLEEEIAFAYKTIKFN